MKRRKWALVLAAVMVMSMLMSITGAQAESTEKKILRISTPYGIATLLPWKSTSDGDRYVFINVYETLFHAVNSDIYPSMATGYTVTDDTVYDITLREDAYWQTGNELFGDEKINVTAQDVYDCFQIYMDESFGANQYGNLTGTIDSIEVVDTYTIRFTTKTPDAMFLKYLSDAPVFPSEAIEKGYDLNKFPVGSGPYKFVEYKTDDQVVLEKNPDFSATLIPGADEVIFKIMTDKSVAAIALQNGEVDVALQLNTTDIEAVSANENLTLVPNSTGWYRYIAFNVDKPMFQDIRVRKAISEMIDFDSIVKAIFVNSANTELALCSFGGGIPLEFAGSDIETWKTLRVFDPAAGQALLEEAGYTKGDDGFFQKDGEKLTFTINAPANDPNRIKLGEMAATYLQMSGVNATAQAVEWATHTADIAAGNVDMFIMGGGSTLNGVYMLYHSEGSKTSSHRTGYVDKDLDAKIEAAFKIVDDEARAEALQEIGVMGLESYIHAGGYFEYIQAGISKKVSGMTDPNLWTPLTYSHRNISIAE